MVGFLNRKKAQNNALTLSPLEAQCIPYACHYDDNSLLTKNGELLQIIKIEALKNDSRDLRETIRQAILKHISNDKVAVWFHTVRKKVNLDTIEPSSWTFAQDTHEGWAGKNYWRSKFINEIYISVLYEGESYNTRTSLFYSFIPKLLKKFHLEKLAENVITLTKITDNIANDLKDFGGKRLKVAHDRFGAHSELLEFLTKIVCLRSKRVALPIQNIDRIFNRSKIAFGGNTLEILDEKEKRYAAIFTIKEYHELSPEALDKFLRISSEFVISQSLTFVPAQEATKDLEYFNYILASVSKDEDLRNACGLDAMFSADKSKATAYAKQQITVMISGNSLEELQLSINNAVYKMRELGVVMIREDLNIALCYWAQLPGNFHFFRRLSYLSTSKSASFASLTNAPSGETENIWGNFLTLFRRANAAPHFFNLHVGSNGNTVIVGPPDFIKIWLAHFLLVESSKYEARTLYIDQFPTSRLLVRALGGRHENIKLNDPKPAFSLNPFILENTPENQEFLIHWILLLSFPDGVFNENDKIVITTAVKDLLENTSVGNRKLSMLVEKITDENIKTQLSTWCKPNKFGLLFDNDIDELGSGAKLLGLNIAEILVSETMIATPALVSYCLYRYIDILNQSPTMIVLNDANILLQNKIFTSMLPIWLEKATNNNALFILVCNSKSHIHPNIAAINDKIATHLFLPDAAAQRFQEAFKLTTEEVNAIAKIQILYRQFMIKQQGERIIAELNLDGLDYVIRVLTGDKEAVEVMEEAIVEVGDNPNRWIISFYKKLFPEMS